MTKFTNIFYKIRQIILIQYAKMQYYNKRGGSVKNVLKIFTILMLIVLILSGCKSNKTQNGNENNIINESQKITSEEIAIKLKEKVGNVGKIVTYTEETDINKLLGRPNQYICKTTFEDTRIEQINQALDEEYFSEEERNEPIGGTIEVFKSEEDMLKRKKYLEEITSSMSAFAEYSYSQGVYLLRLSKELTPTQAKEYESVFYEITK